MTPCIIMLRMTKVKHKNHERKVLKMESVFEIIMGVCFDAAVLLLILHLAKHESNEKGKYGLLFGSFAVGFLLGAVKKFAFGGSPVAFALYVFGFMISVDAFATILSKKSEKNESC